MTDAHDTPTQRATINQLSVDELDAMLEAIRARRLEKVQRLEAVAKVKADDARLANWMSFENAYNTAKRALTKLEEQEKKVEALVHKARIKMLVIRFEIEDAA